MSASFEHYFLHLDPEEDEYNKEHPVHLHDSEKARRAQARLAVWNALTNVERGGWSAAGMLLSERDSVAAHSFSVGVLSFVLSLLATAKRSHKYPQTARRAIATRSLSIGVWHDWLEKLVFDVNTMVKGSVKAQVAIQEEAAKKYLLGSLFAGAPQTVKYLTDLLDEEERRESLAAMVAKCADIVDAQVWRAVGTGRFHPEELRGIMKGLTFRDPIAHELRKNVTTALLTQTPRLAEKRIQQAIDSEDGIDRVHEYSSTVNLAAILQQAKTKPHMQFQRALIATADLPHEADLGQLTLSIIDTFFREILADEELDILPECLVHALFDTLGHTVAGGATRSWTERLDNVQREKAMDAMQMQQEIMRTRLMQFFPPGVRTALLKNFDLGNPLPRTIARTARFLAYTAWATTLHQGYEEHVRVMQLKLRNSLLGTWEDALHQAAGAKNKRLDDFGKIRRLGSEADGFLKRIAWVRRTPEEVETAIRQLEKDGENIIGRIADYHPTI